MMRGWINPGLLRDFKAEGTDAHRLCTIEDGWVERFGGDVLISFKRVLARERLLEELQNWSEWVGFPVRRVFARLIPTKSERRESPALIIGDPSESLQTVAIRPTFRTEWITDIGINLRKKQNREKTKTKTFIASTVALTLVAKRDRYMIGRTGHTTAPTTSYVSIDIRFAAVQTLI